MEKSATTRPERATATRNRAEGGGGADGDDEEDSQCLLTPTTRNPNDDPSSSAQKSQLTSNPNSFLSNVSGQFIINPSVIYSEPQLTNPFMLGSDNAAYSSNTMDATNNKLDTAFSETALQQLGEEPEESIPDHECTSDCNHPTNASTDRGGGSRFNSCRAHTPKSSCFFYSGSQPSIITNPGSAVGYTGGHKQSFSTREIREQHMLIQKKYRPLKRRRIMNPIDFEGILNIIGGCSWWQAWVFFLVSLQQVPHAMFNLSVVYMMYQPDHWCIVPGFNETSPDFKWNLNDAIFNYTIVVPKTANRQRDILDFHSQCYYFNRTLDRYRELRRMTLEEAQRAVDENEGVPMTKCQKWAYKDDVMKKTIVTEWNLVCDDNFKRAHAHLFYSFGFLFGCCLGGFASDRFGRKPAIIGFGVLSSMCGLILPYSTYFPMFLFIRFCGAICNEAADLAAYILCMEITGTKYRSMVGSMLQAPWAVGYAFLALIAYVTKSWKQIQLITAALHTMSICLICILPESPRWLIVNNRVEEAERYIRKACRDPPFPFNKFTFQKSSLPSDLELVRHVEQDKWIKENQRANVMHIINSKVLLLRTLIFCVVWVATALVYYGVIIALSDQSAPGRVLFSGNFFVNNAIAGAIELPTLIFCVYLMKYGRKNAQMFTLIGASIFIFIAMAMIHNKNQMFALSFMLIGKIFIQGAFNILYIFTSELSPTTIRTQSVGVYSMVGRLGSGLASYVAILSDVTLAVVPMLIFAGFSLVAGILVMFLPETQDKPLPETFRDALMFTENNWKYDFYRFHNEEGAGKSSTSLVGGGKDSGNASTIVPAGDAQSAVEEASQQRQQQQQISSNESTSLSTRRSETFTELAPIHEEEPHIFEDDDAEDGRESELRSTTPTGPDDLLEDRGEEDAAEEGERATVSGVRRRHAAGSQKQGRKLSAAAVSSSGTERSLLLNNEEDEKNENASAAVGESLFRELASLSVPENLDQVLSS